MIINNYYYYYYYLLLLLLYDRFNLLNAESLCITNISIIITITKFHMTELHEI